ncbi:hypothetical protein FP2506_11597 [Fulvimarina pelagi HTCC2506]|uniref:Uncharacterized protein n=1 Tax=Fulvimarina pelagi HTCC2506 TaxID=314231 RepID=Q0FYW0_9HYPH|nr:hypothetical protein FP2506_11597 [Fulvimarina pelagi HTCC2506]
MTVSSVLFDLAAIARFLPALMIFVCSIAAIRGLKSKT